MNGRRAVLQNKLIEIAVERLHQLCEKAADDRSHGFVGIKVHYQDGVPQCVSRVLDLKDTHRGIEQSGSSRGS